MRVVNIIPADTKSDNYMAPQVLKTPRFVIRPFERKDLEAFAEYRSNETVAKYQSWEGYSYQDAVNFYEQMDYSTYGSIGQWYQLAIATIESDELVGDIAVHFIDQDQIEIGFTVSHLHQRKSVATEALSRFLTYAFGELNVHRVTAITDVNNTASYRLLEKLAFRREGHFIKNIFFKGAWGDEYQYALLRCEQTFI